MEKKPGSVSVPLPPFNFNQMLDKIVEVTRCQESTAAVALIDHDYDLTAALNSIFDRPNGDGDWVEQKSRKVVKSKSDDESASKTGGGGTARVEAAPAPAERSEAPRVEGTEIRQPLKSKSEETTKGGAADGLPPTQSHSVDSARGGGSGDFSRGRAFESRQRIHDPRQDGSVREGFTMERGSYSYNYQHYNSYDEPKEQNEPLKSRSEESREPNAEKAEQRESGINDEKAETANVASTQDELSNQDNGFTIHGKTDPFANLHCHRDSKTAAEEPKSAAFRVEDLEQGMPGHEETLDFRRTIIETSPVVNSSMTCTYESKSITVETPTVQFHKKIEGCRDEGVVFGWTEQAPRPPMPFRPDDIATTVDESTAPIVMFLGKSEGARAVGIEFGWSLLPGLPSDLLESILLHTSTCNIYYFKVFIEHYVKLKNFPVHIPVHILLFIGEQDHCGTITLSMFPDVESSKCIMSMTLNHCYPRPSDPFLLAVNYRLLGWFHYFEIYQPYLFFAYFIRTFCGALPFSVAKIDRVPWRFHAHNVLTECGVRIM